jgi:hypothetical protein
LLIPLPQLHVTQESKRKRKLRERRIMGNTRIQLERLSKELNLTEVRPRARARRENQSRFG